MGTCPFCKSHFVYIAAAVVFGQYYCLNCGHFDWDKPIGKVNRHESVVEDIKFYWESKEGKSVDKVNGFASD